MTDVVPSLQPAMRPDAHYQSRIADAVRTLTTATALGEAVDHCFDALLNFTHPYSLSVWRGDASGGFRLVAGAGAALDPLPCFGWHADWNRFNDAVVAFGQAVRHDVRVGNRAWCHFSSPSLQAGEAPLVVHLAFPESGVERDPYLPAFLATLTELLYGVATRAPQSTPAAPALEVASHHRARAIRRPAVVG